jgi:sterol desaturase/sphingolipid hydroxylase (fatty acid hydroxylase superfamily)
MTMIGSFFQFPLTPEGWAKLILFSSFFFFLLLEALFPLRRRTRPFGLRLLINLAMTVMVFAVGGLVVRSSALAVSDWAAARHLGLLNMIPLPGWLQLILGFPFLDWTFYHWHKINHQYPLLWRFHNVHHIDPDMDVSTSFRFHWGEVLYSTIFRVLQVAVFGIPLFTYVTYEIIFQLCTMFHHANLRLPFGLEKALNYVFVTPRMHGVHHSTVANENYANFSVVFRWWDWLHKTLRLNIPQQEITIGVPAYLQPTDNRLDNLLLMPFRKQRYYWRDQNGERHMRQLGPEAPKQTEMVA